MNPPLSPYNYSIFYPVWIIMMSHHFPLYKYVRMIQLDDTLGPSGIFLSGLLFFFRWLWWCFFLLRENILLGLFISTMRLHPNGMEYTTRLDTSKVRSLICNIYVVVFWVLFEWDVGPCVLSLVLCCAVLLCYTGFLSTRRRICSIFFALAWFGVLL